MSGGFWVTLGFMVGLVAWLYVTSPRRTRLRRAVLPFVLLALGVTIRLGRR